MQADKRCELDLVGDEDIHLGEDAHVKTFKDRGWVEYRRYSVSMCLFEGSFDRLRVGFQVGLQ